VIDKREIIDSATAPGLNPHVVEKDYVLGWLLWGIHNHDALRESWVFKGGTCLKKCFFETYRFSEDLDFTLTDPGHIDADFLHRVFSEIGERVYEETGIEVPAAAQRFEIYQNPRGQTSCQGRIAYRGPVSPTGKNMPRIALDLTADECVVLSAALSPVFHPFSDEPDGGIAVRSYAYEEAFGEKIRALAERTRPRDLYDVINLFRNADARPAAAALRGVLAQKCKFKGIAIPVLPTWSRIAPNLKADGRPCWHTSSRLCRRSKTFWEALPAFFAWLEGGAAPQVPAAFVGGAGEELILERTLRLPVSGEARSHLEIIRFAASNRLCVELDYQGSTRRIEPYSLRRTLDGNIILHAHNVDRNEHRSYRVDRIQGTRVTAQTFTPRYAVELTPKGPVAIAPTTTGGSRSSGFGNMVVPQRRTRAPRARGIGYSGGPPYVYECSYCGKRFNRKTQTTSLNPHKDKSGYPCSGRYAHLVDTRY
jgi:predicted nucleotidyltransferase component of viral defense system